MRRIPLSALIGMAVTGAFFLAAILAPVIAPYGMAEIAGDVWEPMSSKFWLGTDAIGRFVALLLGLTAVYLALVEMVKRWFYRHLAARQALT